MLAWLKGWVVSLLKKAAVAAVRIEGDRLQEQLRAGIAKEGPASIDKNIDAFQVKVRNAVLFWGPKWDWLEKVRMTISDFVQDFGDKLQTKLKKEVAEYGPSAVDRAFDIAQEALIKKIEAISV